jgi:hypothetical protein
MGLIMSEPERPDALARLDVFVGEWALEARFPDAADGTGAEIRATFEWILDGRFLAQRTHVPVPEAPDSLAIVCADPQAGGYSQHYYDARGVTRRYAMSLDAGVWRLVRDAPDSSPLDFCQRFTGTFSDDRATIDGEWEKSLDGTTWSHDFALTYRRIG